MKRTKNAIAALLCAVTVTLAGCGEKTSPGSSSEAPAVVSETNAASSNSTGAPDETSGPLAGLWSGAKYTEDTEIGAGAHSVLITVSIGGKSVTITVKSDKDNLAEMLTESGLAEGDEGEYGLYIKRVNGVLADYNTDQAYWSLLRNGTPIAMGASSITVKDGDAYELAYISDDDIAA